MELRLTPEERPETTKELGARGNKALPDEIFQAGIDAGAKAQLRKVNEFYNEQARLWEQELREDERKKFWAIIDEYGLIVCSARDDVLEKQAKGWRILEEGRL